MGFQKTGSDGVCLFQVGIWTGGGLSSEHINKQSGCIKGREFLG
jgi:hypothetical protein